MDVRQLPWKETLLIILLIALSMSMSNLKLKDGFIRDIAVHPWIRFIIIFMTAFMIFSIDIDGKYSFTSRVLVSGFIAFIIQTFLAANTTLLTLQPPVSKDNDDVISYPFAG